MLTKDLLKDSKFPLLQLYRAAAASLVVLYHVGENNTQWGSTKFLNNFFKYGYFGVDYFFVLSGFIITYVHYADIEKRANLDTYLKKRLFRIYPIYWFVAAISLVGYIFFSHGHIKLDTTTIQLDSSLDSIIYILKCYFLIPSNLGFFVIVAWTLSFELAFYGMFSIFILSGKKVSYAIFFAWIAWIFLNNYVFHIHGILKLISNFYILQFLMGCVVAFIVLKKYEITNKLLSLLIFSSFLVIGIGMNQQLLSGNTILQYLLFGINAALIILLCTKINKIKSSHVFYKIGILIGDASYSIYLSHVFFLNLLTNIFSDFILQMHLPTYQLNILFVTLFLLVTIFGTMMHLYIEKPVLNLLNTQFIKKKKFTPQLKFA